MTREYRIGFRKELERLINCHSMENGSDTPDFMLAEYLVDCLATFDKTINERDKWYGRKSGRMGEQPAPEPYDSNDSDSSIGMTAKDIGEAS